MQPPYAPIGGIGASFEEPARFQPVYQSADRDRLHFTKRRHLILRQARLTFQARKDDALRTRHSVIARPLVESGALHAGHVMQEDQHVPVEVLHSNKLSHAIITCNKL